MNLWHTQILVFKYLLPLKGTRALQKIKNKFKKIADSKAGAMEGQDEPQVSSCAANYGSA